MAGGDWGVSGWYDRRPMAVPAYATRARPPRSKHQAPPPAIPMRRTLLTAVGHTITAVIGAGVLNLPYAVSMLGWVAGPAAILLFSWITLFTSHLLAECHLYNGQRLRTYTDVVFVSFGKRGYHMLAW